MQANITAALISAIVTKCGVSDQKAAEILKNAKVAAKMTGLPVADTLQAMGVV